MEEYSISQNASRCTFYFLSFCGQFVENSTTLCSQSYIEYRVYEVFIECYFICTDQVNYLTPLSSCKLDFELNKCWFMMQLCSIIIKGLRATHTLPPSSWRARWGRLRRTSLCPEALLTLVIVRVVNRLPGHWPEMFTESWCLYSPALAKQSH